MHGWCRRWGRALCVRAHPSDAGPSVRVRAPPRVHAPCVGWTTKTCRGGLQTSGWQTAHRARHYARDTRSWANEQIARDGPAAGSVRVTKSTFYLTIGAFLGWAKVLLKQYRAILGPPPLSAVLQYYWHPSIANLTTKCPLFVFLYRIPFSLFMCLRKVLIYRTMTPISKSIHCGIFISRNPVFSQVLPQPRITGGLGIRWYS